LKDANPILQIPLAPFYGHQKRSIRLRGGLFVGTQRGKHKVTQQWAFACGCVEATWLPLILAHSPTKLKS
jgi:hypothetical protein